MRSLVLVFSLMVLVSAASLAQNGVWVNYTTANSNLVSDTVTSVAIDANNVLWLGTWFGLDQYDGSKWTSYYQDETHGLTNDIFDLNYSLGSLWVGHRDGLTQFDGSKWKTYTSSNSGLVDEPVMHLANDHENLWIGTQYGLNRLTDQGDWTTYKPTNTPTMPYYGISAIALDKYENVWLGFIGTPGIVEFPVGNSTRAKYFSIDTIPNFPYGYITTMAVDNSGNLWVGLEEEGIVKINGAGGTLHSTKTTSAFHDDHLHKVMVDQCGKVWVGTEAGAVVYDGTNWISVTKSGGNLTDDFIYAISVDAYGHVWFGTKGGISEFKPYPEKPYLIYPANWATIVTDSVFCHWTQSCPSILKYWYELADNPNFTNSKIDTTSVSLMVNTSHWDTILQNNGTYYWRVKAKNDAGWGPFSDTWSFTVNKPLGRVNARSNFDCDLSIFPNPSEFGVILSFSLPARERYTVTINDETGKSVIAPVTGVMDAGPHEIPLPLMGLANGSYMVTLQGDDVLASTRLIVLH